MSRSSYWRSTPVLLGAVLLGLAWLGIAVSAMEDVAPPAAPVPGEASLEGTVTKVSPSGESFTVGTKAFSFPDIPMDVLDDLKPGSFVRVRFANEGGQNVVTSIWVVRAGFGNAALWSRAPGTVIPGFGSAAVAREAAAKCQRRRGAAGRMTAVQELQNVAAMGLDGVTTNPSLIAKEKRPFRAAADGKSYAKQFSGKYSRRILKGIGHNVPQEAPRAFAKAIVEVDGY